MDLLVNIDVPDLAQATAFYTAAFNLTVSRRLGQEAAELSGLPVRIYLLEKPPGSRAVAGQMRRYDRHWTPVHLDIVVDEIEAALKRAVRAGALPETAIAVHAWGKMVVLSDPFGHGICLIQFLGRGYDEISREARKRADSRGPNFHGGR